MRTFFIILIATSVTILNINSFGELDSDKLHKAKEIGVSSKEIKLEKTFNWVAIGVNFFKFFHFAELMFISEVGRKKFFLPFN